MDTVVPWILDDKNQMHLISIWVPVHKPRHRYPSESCLGFCGWLYETASLKEPWAYSRHSASRPVYEDARINTCQVSTYVYMIDQRAYDRVIFEP